MKQLLICLSLLFVILSGCQKSGNSDSTATNSPKVTPAPVAPPSSAFKVLNTVDVAGVEGAAVKEGTPLALENDCTNGYNYVWDFGNGNTSTERVPNDMYLYPCTQTHTITLTVTNDDGVSSTSSQTFYVACYRLFSGGRVGTMPANWPQH